MRHIALIAPMLSGKSTAADHLVSAHGYRKIALADPLKDACADILSGWTQGWAPVTRADIDADKATFRPFLQWFGTDFVRGYLGADDYWIRQFFKAVAQTEAPVVCDDVRFPNEAAALKAAGFTLVRIVRPEAVRCAAIRERFVAQGVHPDDAEAERLKVAGHPSETAHADILADVTILNNGGIDKLQSELDCVVRWGGVPASYA